MKKMYCDNCGIEVQDVIIFGYTKIHKSNEVDGYAKKLYENNSDEFLLPDKPNTTAMNRTYDHKKELCDFCYCRAMVAALKALEQI